MNDLLKSPDQQGAEPNRAFLEYFRCPPEYAPFTVAGEPSKHEGFFRFGPTTCYGSPVGGHASADPANALFDASEATKVRPDEIALGFNPSEVADNLRHEKYLPDHKRDHLLRSAYYSLRPALPPSIRRAIQRLVVSRRLRAPFPSWSVDFSVEQLFRSLMESVLSSEGVHEVPFIWFWPEGSVSALMMTHDVEHRLGAAQCEMVMDMDDSVGIKAAFQLIPEVRYNCFEKLVDEVRARGFEANLHDLNHDGRLYEDLRLFRKRAAKINEYGRRYRLNGFRAGAMHRNQNWFGLLDFQYDMSVPTVSHLQPQPGGCCSIMPYFLGDLLELPLTTVQDYELFYILQQDNIQLWKDQIEIICAQHGLISFIIHPDYIAPSAERHMYHELLRHLGEIRSERQIWWALPGEINLWWRQRSQMSLVRNGNHWDIKGPGQERARIALARMSNGQLEYRFSGRHDNHSNSWESLGSLPKRPNKLAWDN